MSDWLTQKQIRRAMAVWCKLPWWKRFWLGLRYRNRGWDWIRKVGADDE